jgi:hypothetical protein
MITIRETIVSTKLLEPTFVKYRVDTTILAAQFEPVRFAPKRSHRFQPLIAGVYGTNLSPRDQMRHDHRWRQLKMPTQRYQTIGS